MNMNTPKKTPAPTRWNATGPCCKCGARPTVLVTREELRAAQLQPRVPVPGAFGMSPISGAYVVGCACGVMARVQQVRGKISTAHKCDPRCTGARGFSCLCACGGMNHGSEA